MKKALLIAITAVMAFIVSCNFTEEIYINDDGSGKLSINFDGSEFMQMAGEEMAADNEEAMDSIVSFADMLEENKDSIAQLSAEERAELEKLKPFKLHMLMNPETKELKFDMFADFGNVNEVNDAFNAFQKIDQLQPDKKQNANPMPMGLGQQTSKVEYGFIGNTFKRNVIILDSVLLEKSKDSLQQAAMFLGGSTYTIKYHFPKRVKSTTVEGATFSMDGKTLIYEVPFMELITNPELLSFDVVLE